ncbi:pseudouridine synthase [uncultured Bifidobacterium sp.]|uniref:pseudouridine synthase n=1 Tax=uncultured Bifidobacterium sp. TaxID=165187 RepID=UPI0028DC0CA1|nr:pseudouridine synthase [uncultured Bifidobacterium sp.]
MDVLYEDERIIVVDKPHFLATTPRGMWYRQTALIRLRETYDDPLITPAHRLDRATAGVVVFVRVPFWRGAYQLLFQNRRVEKTYECIGPELPVAPPRHGEATPLDPPHSFPMFRRSHIVKTRGVLQAYETDGDMNAETLIEAGETVAAGLRRYVLHPRTGRTHQLRLHMCSLGLPILGDDLYPRVLDRPYDDFASPLQLVARSLRFVDPATGETREFVSRIPLTAAASDR